MSKAEVVRNKVAKAIQDNGVSIKIIRELSNTFDPIKGEKVVTTEELNSYYIPSENKSFFNKSSSYGNTVVNPDIANQLTVKVSPIHNILINDQIEINSIKWKISELKIREFLGVILNYDLILTR